MRWSAIPSLRAGASAGVQTQRTSRFDRDLAGAPPSIQQAFEKQFALLLTNPRHPSLLAKKYDEARGIWQARVTRDWRLYFTTGADVYMLRTIRLTLTRAIFWSKASADLQNAAHTDSKS
jgi:hypothetical protein